MCFRKRSFPEMEVFENALVWTGTELQLSMKKVLWYTRKLEINQLQYRVNTRQFASSTWTALIACYTCNFFTYFKNVNAFSVFKICYVHFPNKVKSLYKNLGYHFWNEVNLRCRFQFAFPLRILKTPFIFKA